ncbi:Uncharacterised protein [Mycobacteroides abscessus subsp. abscessus]|nr:Uncharacterised protein [Mycobacteroides abscessus subsp. abscessus]
MKRIVGESPKPTSDMSRGTWRRRFRSPCSAPWSWSADWTMTAVHVASLSSRIAREPPEKDFGTGAIQSSSGSP